MQSLCNFFSLGDGTKDTNGCGTSYELVLLWKQLILWSPIEVSEPSLPVFCIPLVKFTHRFPLDVHFFPVISLELVPHLSSPKTKWFVLFGSILLT